MYMHLTRSGNHDVPKKEFDALVDDAEILEMDNEQKLLRAALQDAQVAAASIDDVEAELVDRTVGTVLAQLGAEGFASAPSSLWPDIAIRASDFQVIMDSIQRFTPANRDCCCQGSSQDEGVALVSAKQNLETIATANGFEFSIQF